MSKTVPERIVLNFDLFDLPTAQHKAGLAGMLLQIQSMVKHKVEPRCVPQVEWTRTSARVEFTQESVQGLFDDLYAAKIIEVAVAAKWAKVTPKGETFEDKVDPSTKKVKSVKKFLYDVVQPQAPCLNRYMESPEDNPWLKLWRTMLWAIPRGINTTRAPFNERAESPHCSVGATAWELIRDFDAKRKRNQFKTDSVSSALLLGAQDVNAESVPFRGRVDQNLLLHFWQVVVLTYLPQKVDHEGQCKSKGYVLAIPEVSDLKEFLHSYPELLATLKRKTRGYLPAEAFIDIPAQANLEFLRSLRALVADKARGEQWQACVSAIESFHMEKVGNNIKLLTFERVVNRPGLIDQYERITSTFRNPLFRAAVLRSLLRNQPWYGGMLELFAERPWPFFVEDEQTPKYLPRFARDARSKLQGIFEDIKDMNSDELKKDQKDNERLAMIVQRLVKKYVDGRAEAKSGKKVKDFAKVMIDGRERRVYPTDFREQQQRVCSDTFLAMRSRHDNDFVAYFVGSICSVAQYLPDDDYQFLTQVLLRQSPASPTGPRPVCWEDVKALAMMSVSAYSFTTQPRESKPQETKA